MNEKKIKILSYLDAPTCATGFGSVSRNILEALYKTGRYDVDILGINYWGDPHSFPYRIWPVGNNQNSDPYGRKKICSMIPKMEYDILFFLQDTFILDFLPELIPYLKHNREQPFGSVVYFPIDGFPKQQWIKNVSVIDNIVAYTEFGKQAAVDSFMGVSADDISVIPHGVNIADYHPLPDKQVDEFRKQYFGKHADKFIFMNLSRNQQRKDVPRTIQAFVEFRKQAPESLLYLHMAQQDQGWDLVEVCKAYGLSISEDVIFPENFGPNQGYPRQVVNALYNASDCVVSTCLGEGFGLCIHPETNVYTKNGIKFIKDVTVSDSVLSSDGNYNEIEGIMTKAHDGDLYEITTWMSNIPVKTSPDHGFLVRDSDDSVWKKASELSVGDVLMFPKDVPTGIDSINVLGMIRPSLSSIQINNIVETESDFKIQSNFTKEGRFIPKNIKITEDLMYLFGLFLAEGCVGASKTDCVMFSFHKEEKQLMSFVEECMDSVFGLPCKYADHACRGPNYNGQTIIFYSSVVAQLFKSLFGLGARNKYIHRILLEQPNNMLQKLLYGEFMGDGSYGSSTFEFSISTTSKHIAYALRLIMARMGIIASVRTSRVEYKVNVSGSSKRKLLGLFNIPYPDVDQKYGNDRAGQNDSFLLLPIKDIKVSKYKGKLVDIQVANTNDFVAENVVVHNSWIESMATKTPVIMPDNTAMSEFITGDRGYLAKSGTSPSLWTVLPHDNEVRRPLVDVDDMVKKMLEVYNDRTESKRRANNAYKWVTTKMNWQGEIGEQWIKLFDSVYNDVVKSRLGGINVSSPNVDGKNIIESESF